jgi:hypothetical protein
VRLAIEPWDPDFGPSFQGAELRPTDATVDPGVEVAPDRWKPVASKAAPASTVVFVDGVRRIDARAWITLDGTTTLGVCASYAAGTVEAGTSAEVRDIEVRRGLFSTAAAEDLTTSIGTFTYVADDDEQGVQNSLRNLETELAARLARPRRDVRLVVVDGPLSGHHTTEATVGYIKSHRVTYLDEALTRTVHTLAPGERTPLFFTTTSWSRYSAYLRLPGSQGHPWAGIVRIEIAAEARLEEAKRLADVAASTLPRYASTPFKDPRAPQNLFPIGGLERELRHRLGDAALVHRALRVSAQKSI